MTTALAVARAFLAGRVYYGWYIVAVAFLSFGVSVGLTSYTLGVFLRPMSTDLGWSVSTLVAAQSLGAVVSGLTAFV
ncbi:MAG: MFS transporter, partial [Chloroflexi bacterium]|nr:MFS transporter [Chloroflexota bacterium]